MRNQMFVNGFAAGVLGLTVLGIQSAWTEEPEATTETQPTAIAVAEAESAGQPISESAKDEKKAEADVKEESKGAKEAKSRKLWLGIAIKKIEGDLAAYLGNSDGVLVINVAPDSPAASAGVNKGDILISVDGKSLSEPKEFLEIMKSASEGVALKLKILRKSETRDLSVTPQLRHFKRSNLAFRQHIIGEDGSPLDLGEIELDWDSKDVTDGLRMFRLGEPSVLFLPDHVELQGNFSIVMTKEHDGKTVEVKISKEADKPAEITVKQGDQVETLTEHQLDKLPEELHNWVKSVLSTKKSKWVDLSANLADKYGDASIRFGSEEMADLQQLLNQLRSLGSSEFENGKVEVKKLIEELTRKAKAQAQEALRKAFEQAGRDVEHTGQKARELALKYAEQVLNSAEAATGQSKSSFPDQASKATDEESKRSDLNDHQATQIAELKAMIEQLQKEIAELRESK